MHKANTMEETPNQNTEGQQAFNNTTVPLSDEDIFGQKQPDYAGFWLRVAAWLIDIILLSIAMYPIRLAFGLSSPHSIQELYTSSLSYSAISALLQWLYFALMESSTRQATLGKRAVGIYVTDEEGRQINFAKATGRHFSKYISGLILLAGYIMAAFTKKKQALHDIIAGTLVVK